jgi:phosphoribosylcarboxyaminoimidazole (NCAIR) mutase
VALIDRLVSAGHAGDAMMNSARDALVQSIHIGILVAGAAALVGLCLAWFVPPVRIGYPEAEVMPGGGSTTQGDALPPRGNAL